MLLIIKKWCNCIKTGENAELSRKKYSSNYVKCFLRKHLGKSFICFTILLIVASLLRFISLDNWLPLFVDEAAYFNRALDIYQTGQIFSLATFQHKGFSTILSLIFYIRNDYSYVYLRIFDAICGVFSVLLTYKLFKDMYNLRVGFIAGILLSIMPYHVFYSRIGLFYSFRMLIFIGIVFLTFKFLKASVTKKTLLILIISIITLTSLQLDPTLLMWLIPYLFSFFFIYSSILWFQRKHLGHVIGRINKKLVIVVFAIVLLALLVLFYLGSLNYLLNLIVTEAPEKGWERLFGWSSLSSSFWSINWVTTYLLILVSFPIFCLSMPGISIAILKRKYLPVVFAMLITAIASFWIGYYPRRVLIITPLFALFAALSINMLYEKLRIRFNKRIIVSLSKHKGVSISVSSMILIILMVLFLFWPLYQSVDYVNNFNSLEPPEIPTVMKTIFVSEWTSGAATMAAADFVTNNIPQGSTLYVDLDNNLQLKAVLAKYDYTIISIGECGFGSQWSITTYENILQNKEKFGGSYFVFLYPQLVLSSATFDLPWIKIVNTNYSGAEESKNFAIYKFNDAITLADPTFTHLTALEGNYSSVWKTYFVGANNAPYSLDLDRVDQLDFSFKAFNTQWTNVGLMQYLNTKWTNLSNSPVLEVTVEIERQDPEATLRVAIEVENSDSNSLNIILLYANKTITGISENSTTVLYLTKNVSLGAQTITIDINDAFTAYFGRMGLLADDFAMKSIAVGAGSKGGLIDFSLNNVNLVFSND